jgi:hypothetical protein
MHFFVAFSSAVRYSTYKRHEAIPTCLFIPLHIGEGRSIREKLSGSIACLDPEQQTFSWNIPSS